MALMVAKSDPNLPGIHGVESLYLCTNNSVVYISADLTQLHSRFIIRLNAEFLELNIDALTKRLPQVTRKLTCSRSMQVHLLFLIFTSIIILLLSCLGLLSLHTTWATATEWRCEGKINMLLRVEADDE
jgi:hypothetical protein